MRLRDRERDFGRRREEATIRGGGCGEPALPIWFRPKSEKVRVWVWGKSGKREVDAQSPWLSLAATVFYSTNSSRGSGKVPLSPSLIFPSFNFLNKKKKRFFNFQYCIRISFSFDKEIEFPVVLGKEIMWNLCYWIQLVLGRASSCNHTTASGGAYRRCLHHWWLLVPFFFSLLSLLFLFAFQI